MTEKITATILAQAILEVGRKAQSEEDVRIGVEHALSQALESLGLNRTAEYEKTTFSGSMDAVYGHVIIEYKRPGRFAEKGFPAKLSEQLSKYMLDFARKAGGREKQSEALEKLIGIGLDGDQILFLRYSATERKRDLPSAPLPGTQTSFYDITDFDPEGPKGGFQMIGPAPVTKESVGLLLLYLRSLSRKPLTPEALAEVFGPQSDIARQLVNAFYQALQEHIDNPRLATFFAEWQRIFGIVYGEELDDAQKDAPELAGLYGVPIGKGHLAPLQTMFFAVHTYYALLMKFLAVELASLQEGALVGSFAAILPSMSDNDMHRSLTELENGGTFAYLGINNFLEGDFFGWYLNVWDGSIGDAIRAMSRALSDFEPATSTLEPEHTRDLLKKLYQYLVPKKLRHDLGEYYTPDWLAERLLNQVGYHGEIDKRLVDPGCGSGTFPILALKRLRNYASDHLIPPVNVLDAALHNIAAFDLNPLSVIAARTNYLLALGDLLRFRSGNIDIPVYLCDSILTPSEYGDMFGKLYRLHTVVGDFELPAELVSLGEMSKLAKLIEDCVKNDYSPEDFMARARKELTISQPNTDHYLEALYRRFLTLEKEGRNGIWARLIKNAFAPVLVGQFDYVIGNPPWVNWESLSQEYREATKSTWERYSLQAHSDSDQFALGKVKRDISMLFTFVCIDKYLKDGGTLGFVITQTVFKTKSGEVFRQFRAGKNTPFRVIHVDDMVELQPFEGASNWTSVFVCEKGKITHYPVPYTLWKTLPKNHIDPEDSLDDVIAKTKRINFVAAPVQSKIDTSPWITAYPKAINAISNAIGKSDYTARAGIVTWADGVYWLKVISKRPDGNLIVENLNEVGKKTVDCVQVAMEPNLLYPFARWTDISRWHVNPSCYLLLPHTAKTGWKAIEESNMKLNFPLSYAYLKRFELLLLKRSGYIQLRQGEPFYILTNTGDWIYSSWKVAWKGMGTKMEAAVLPSITDQFVGQKPIMHKNTVVFIPCTSEDEAHFLCAVLNSTITNFTAKSYSVGKSFGSPHLLEQVHIPKFSLSNLLHINLASLSKQAHIAITNNKDISIIEADIDRVTSELWNITNKELDDIKKSLEEF